MSIIPAVPQPTASVAASSRYNRKMRFLIRALLFLLVIGGLCVGVAYFAAPRLVAAPTIEIKTPEKYVGQATPLEFFVNAGIYAVSPEAVTLIEPERRTFDMTDLIDAVLAQGGRVGGFPVREYWLDIGQVDDYSKARTEYEQHFADESPVES